MPIDLRGDMKVGYPLIRLSAAVALASALLLSLTAGASFLGFGATSWKEEVLLHDSSKIIVDRSVKFGGRHEIGQEPPYKWQRLRFTMPVTGEVVTWEDNYSKDLGAANFLPMLLDIEHGTAYMAASTMGCLSYNKWGRPNPPYVVFKYENKEWKRIPLQELPAEIKLPNLLHSSPDEVAERRAKGGVVTARVIREENDEYRQPEFRSILREPFPTAAGGCPVLELYKGGWVGPGDSIGRRMMDQMSK